MKNTVLLFLSTKLALASFLMAGLFLFAPQQISAQSDLATVQSKPNLVTADEAINRLEAETAALKTQLETLVPETLAYKTALSKYELFTFVLNRLQEGKTVGEAIVEGFNLYESNDWYASIPLSIRNANKNELILILEV